MSAVVDYPFDVELDLRVVPGSQFMAAFEPMEHVVEQILPRGRLTALTAPTGHGKTAISTSMELHVAAGLPFATRETVEGGGRVLALVGENPEDKQMRLIATAQHMGLSPEICDRLLVVPNTFDIGEALTQLTEIVDRHHSVALVTVDTSAAFYGADEENNNVAMRRHASMLRQLTRLPGNPAVLVLCHPTKAPTRDNLVPRGGGAFLAEIDGNLTAWNDNSVVTLHWSGKFRGPTFDPIKFELREVDLQGRADRKGRPVPSVIALHIPDERVEQLQEKALDDENRVLLALWRKPDASVAEVARACGWALATGAPSKSRVQRNLEKLARQGLIKKARTGVWELTPEGKREAEKLR